MTSLITILTAASSLLLGAGGTDDAHVAELGGMVAEQGQNRPFPAPVPVELSLYADHACVASTFASVDGRYQLAAEPGDYWLQVKVGGTEALSKPVTLTPGSWKMDLAVPEPESGMRVWDAVEGTATIAGLRDRIARVLRDLAEALPPPPYLPI